MYCIKCGCQLSDDANFCHRCGTKVQLNTPDVISYQKKDQELDRTALKIYLNDVLTLECIKVKYIEKIKIADNGINVLKNNLGRKKIPLAKNPQRWQWCHLFYDGQKIHIAHIGNPKAWLWGDLDGVYTDEVLSGTLWKWYEVEPIMNRLKDLSSWRYSTSPNTGMISGFDLRYKREEALDRFLKGYEEFKNKAPELCSRTKEQINKIEALKTGLKQELQKTNHLLEKVYNVNIIPSNLRNNIYAVYYLNEYIKTSNESFSSALLHFDLDEIKAKLDIIIQQQREIIVQQAVIAAQNKQLLQQNKMKLDQLYAIESNTARAAQYAEIAAHNSEISTWISFNNYLKS